MPSRLRSTPKTVTALTAAGATLLLGLSAASAAPLAPHATLQPAVATGPTDSGHMGAKLTLIRGGCGWGAHRTWHGYCHLNYGWRGRVRAHWAWWHHRWL